MTAIGVPSKDSIKHDMSGETESDQVRFGTTGVMLVHQVTLLEIIKYN